jgi:transmembrane 9 superfamily protein 3
LPVLVLLGALVGVLGSEKNHVYQDKEKVVLWVNKVGPYNNPQETYNYFYLPFCKAHPEQKDEHSWGGLGEVLQGNELIDSKLDIRFKGM